jgi:hypothetical protein
VATAAKMRAPMTPAVMTPAVSTTMAAAAMTAAAMTAAAMTAAAFRRGISCGRQHGRENNDGDPDIEF